MDENITPPPGPQPAPPGDTTGSSAEGHPEHPQLPAGTPQKQIAGPPGSAPPPTQPARHPASKRGWLWFVALLIVAVVVYFLWPKVFGTSGSASTAAKSGKGTGKGGSATNVVATRARRGNIGVYFTGLGSVTPIYTVTVKSRVDGQLMTVNYKEGEIVQKDDLLVQIDPRPYEAALTQAEGALLRDQALLANARIDLARYQMLIKTKAVPEQMLATQEALVKQDEGIVKTDEGAVASAKVNVVYTKITAPITGRVGLRLVDPGNIVQTSDTNGLVVITQIDPISVIFTISEDQLPRCSRRCAPDRKLQVDAFDREMKNKIAHGTLTTLDNEIDQTTGTVRVARDFRQQDRRAVPESVRECAAAGAGKAYGSGPVGERGHPAQLQLHIRVSGAAGFDSYGSQHHAGNDRGRRFRDHFGPERGRRGGDDRRGQTGGRQQSECADSGRATGPKRQFEHESSEKPSKSGAAKKTGSKQTGTKAGSKQP